MTIILNKEQVIERLNKKKDDVEPDLAEDLKKNMLGYICPVHHEHPNFLGMPQQDKFLFKFCCYRLKNSFLQNR
jgi:hypothetical protein